MYWFRKKPGIYQFRQKNLEIPKLKTTLNFDKFYILNY